MKSIRPFLFRSAQVTVGFATSVFSTIFLAQKIEGKTILICKSAFFWVAIDPPTSYSISIFRIVYRTGCSNFFLGGHFLNITFEDWISFNPFHQQILNSERC